VIGIEGLKTEIQEVVGNDVDIEWQGDILKLVKWSTILTVHWAFETKDGMFWCEICGEWINHQRWGHYKKYHLKYV
jgi:hypothetical protein